MSLIKTFLQEGILIESSLLEFFKTNEIAPELVDIIKGFDVHFLSKEFFYLNTDKIFTILENIKQRKKDDEKKIIEDTIKLISVFRKEEKEDKEFHEEKTESNYKIIESWNVPSRKIYVEDFANHFKSRLLLLKTILQERSELQNLTAINKIPIQKQNVISIIGLVTEKRVTKNNNIILEIEDFTGRISILVNHTKEDVYKKAQQIIFDEVIGVRCSGSREILFANDILFPDSFATKKTSEKDECAAFISDVHLGSVNFLENEFLKFIGWLNLESGNESQQNDAKKVRYLFIAGDVVDGIGVYPGQEEMLKIKDVKEQYAKLAEFLGKIRKDITIFIIPGQHDAVRLAEPQPPIGKDYAPDLYKLKNVVLLSNPSVVEVNNKTVLMYHGDSFHDIIDNVESLRFSKARNTPSAVVKMILSKRHIAPTHSYSIYVPVLNEDPLVIREVPDIFATGELHKPDVNSYNGTRIIASSCWQSTTPHEEKIGNIPDPCKVPILNLKNNTVKIMDFS